MSKVVLAYGGYLEDQTILKWLCGRGDEVVCFIADVGQQADVDELEEEARRIGAHEVIVSDLCEDLVTQFLFPALKANARYEGVCLLGDALTTCAIAKHQVEAAVDAGSTCLCNGARGKGIGQMRFELVYQSLLPKVQVIHPWSEQSFLQLWSSRAAAEPDPRIKQSVIQTTYSSTRFQDAHLILDEGCFRQAEMAESPVEIAILFENGVPIAVEQEADEERVEGALNLVAHLNQLASRYGIGFGDVVVNRYASIKWRELYEAPAATLLWLAHRDLEGLALDKQVLAAKERLGGQIAECVYNGLCFSPEMRLLMAAIEESQEDLTGKVHLRLFKGGVQVLGRETVLSRYCATLNRMEQLAAFEPTDVRGFLHMHALRLQQRVQ